ncbi:MAG: tetratricopeptide repeat protein [Magnetococcales bacterium]|nr:tetratricopeptide repeat protein [Magnetococcales bacterium]
MNKQQTNHTVDEKYSIALDCYNTERYTEADQICTAILKTTPNYIYAINLLGLIAQKINRHDLAVEQFQKAINIDDSIALLSYNLGTSLLPIGQIKEVEKALKKAVAIHSSYVEAYSSLGNALTILGEFNEAFLSLQKAISINPDYADAHYNLGNLLIKQGEFEKAEDSFQQAISINPNYIEAYSNLGFVKQAQGELEEAAVNCKKVISLNPEFAEAYSNLGFILQSQFKLEEAVEHYLKAISIKPNFADAHYNIGVTLLIQNQPNIAFQYFQNAIRIDTKNGEYLVGYASCLEDISFEIYDHNTSLELLYLVDQPTILPKRIARAIASKIHHHPDMLYVTEQIQLATYRDNIQLFIKKLSSIQLLIKLMKLTTIEDSNLEQFFTLIRQSMLYEVFESKNELTIQPFQVALAIHCYINGYLYYETNKEKKLVTKLQQQIASYIKNNREIPPVSILVLGCYLPLYKTTFSERLLEITWPDEILEVIKQQIKEPNKELEIRSKIKCLAPVKNTISKKVKNQYEENPYPVWVTPNISVNKKTVKQFLKDIHINLNNFKGKFPDKPEILIAGCGTGQQPIQSASNFINSTLVAVDLSLSSLAYAIRKTNELKVTNINYIQGDIYDLKKLGVTFDIIECRGVLHHLDDPIAGWQVLVDILRQNGIMKIGLYSKIARKGVINTRKLIEKKGYNSTPDDIRECRKYIFNMPPDENDEIYTSIFSFDFYSMSECRDLLFHEQESQFTLLEIKEALKELGLQFLGFEFSSPRVIKLFKETYNEENSTVSLEKWHEFEQKNPKTFRGLYEFWVQKK